MIGLMMLLALGLYLAISAGVVAWTVRWAKRNGRGVWRWGIAAGFLMYLLVFWDHIPTLVLHKHYCATKAGFWVYKTPEQWKAENPGVAETLTWRDSLSRYDQTGVTRGYKLNERFVWIDQVEHASILPVRLTQEAIVDIKTNETMVKRTIVGSGYGVFPVGGDDWKVLKFWVKSDSCVPYQREFSNFRNKFHQLGREVK